MLNALTTMTLQVNVKDNNVEQALRSLKKKMQREGLYKEMKLRKHFEKPFVEENCLLGVFKTNIFPQRKKSCLCVCVGGVPK